MLQCYLYKKNKTAHRICILNNIAFCIRKVSYEENLYYVEKYNTKNVLKTLILRKDINLPYTPSNRLKLNEYDAWKKVFELYMKQAEIINKKTNIKPEVIENNNLNEVLNITSNKLNLKSSGFKQIDLLEMIEEVENENKSMHDK